MSLTVTPTSGIAKQIVNLRNLLAGSDQWQTITAQASAALAKEYIHLDRTTSVEVYPFAIIDHTDAWNRELTGSGGSWRGDGSLNLEFFLEVPTAYASNPTDAMTDHLNKVGTILEEMETLAINANTTNGYLAMRSYSRSACGQMDPNEVNGKTVYYSDFQIGFVT